MKKDGYIVATWSRSLGRSRGREQDPNWARVDAMTEEARGRDRKRLRLGRRSASTGAGMPSAIIRGDAQGGQDPPRPRAPGLVQVAGARLSGPDRRRGTRLSSRRMSAPGVSSELKQHEPKSDRILPTQCPHAMIAWRYRTELAMAQVIVRHLEDETVRLLKERARRKGHSLEQELREILAAAARQDMVEFKARRQRSGRATKARLRPTACCSCAKIVTGERRRRRQCGHQMVRARVAVERRRNASWAVATLCSLQTSC